LLPGLPLLNHVFAVLCTPSGTVASRMISRWACRGRRTKVCPWIDFRIDVRCVDVLGTTPSAATIDMSEFIAATAPTKQPFADAASTSAGVVAGRPVAHGVRHHVATAHSLQLLIVDLLLNRVVICPGCASGMWSIGPSRRVNAPRSSVTVVRSADGKTLAARASSLINASSPNSRRVQLQHGHRVLPGSRATL